MPVIAGSPGVESATGSALALHFPCRWRMWQLFALMKWELFLCIPAQ